MKQLFVLLVLGAFGAAMMGCHADAGVGDDHGGTTYKKQTTTVDTPAGRTTETTVHTAP